VAAGATARTGLTVVRVSDGPAATAQAPVGEKRWKRCAGGDGAKGRACSGRPGGDGKGVKAAPAAPRVTAVPVGGPDAGRRDRGGRIHNGGSGCRR